jgi:Pectinacetylesterase
MDPNRTNWMIDSPRRRPARNHALGARLALALALTTACGDPADPGSTALELGADDAWQWYPIAGAQCRDGSQAGFSVSPHAGSKKLLMFFEGGGACYDAQTCLVNPALIPSQTPPFGASGVFDRKNAENPFADWNVVYVPYCTGDVHAGANPNGQIPGVSGTQRFVGYTNVGLFLERLAPTFEGAEHVVIVGSSAGGFGSSANVPQVLRAFPGAKGNLINDSGPPMSSKYLPPCLQAKWRTSWGLEGSMLAECGADCPNKDDYTFDFAKHLTKTYAQQKSGLISSSEDGVIRYFFGLGKDDCTRTGVLGVSEPGIAPAEFTEGLLEFREEARKFDNFGTFYPPSELHTWLAGNGLYSTTVGGVKMVDWMREIIEDKAARHIGPD